MNKKVYVSPQSIQFLLETEPMMLNGSGSEPGGGDDYDGTAEIPPFEWGSSHKDIWESDNWGTDRWGSKQE